MSTGLTQDDFDELDDSELDDELVFRVLDGLDDEAVFFAYPSAVRAYLATRTFEWEVGNGGLHQFFFNRPEGWLHQAVCDGYEAMGLAQQALLVRDILIPAAATEAHWRASLQSKAIGDVFEGHSQSELSVFDGQIGQHDDVRMEFVRRNSQAFID